MPQGHLFLKVKSGYRTNSYPDTEDWIDAFTRYGMSLEDGGISRILAPAPNKTPVSNSSAVSDGVAYLGASIGKKNARTIAIPLHIVASSRSEFLQKYTRLCQEILDAGYFLLKLSTSYENRVHHFLYQDCQQFAEYNMEMAKFTLTLLEPHPEITTENV